MIRAEKYCLLECKSQRVEVAGTAGSELVSLHRKAVLPSRSFAVSKNQLALGGAVSPLSARPQMPKHKEYKNKKKYLMQVHLGEGDCWSEGLE